MSKQFEVVVHLEIVIDCIAPDAIQAEEYTYNYLDNDFAERIEDIGNILSRTVTDVVEQER